MPLSKQDVLAMLADPVLARMDFSAAGLRISGRQFGWVRTLVEDEDIVVVEGTVGNAYYNSGNNTLTTQNANSPPDLDARALLLHECVHALIDMEKLRISRLSNEVVCYVVQHAYMLLSNPRWTVQPNSNVPWFNFYTDIAAFVRTHKLDKPDGFGATIADADLAPLRPQLNNLNIYQHLKDHDMSLSNGVLTKPRPLASHPPTAPYRIAQNETMPEASDDYIVDVLKKRYAASDVAGYGGRLRELELVFREQRPQRARTRHGRLQSRMAGDPMSQFFHDHLSTSARVRLVAILKNRF